MNPGTRIGPYEIVAWLGAGGMGEVYRARDSRLGRDVAIKLIAATFATDTNRVHRFEQEARAAGQLNHPNILVVYDTGLHDGAPYIVSELLEGESVRGRLAAGAMAASKAIDCARQIAEGLAAAHGKGIVHRDVKPDNLFITNDGRIKILDFGIAKLAEPVDDGPRGTGAPTDTAAGTVVGTVDYMSPEQVRGEPVDARSDIFSLGTVLHEMLTGRPPFRRATAAESMAAILKEEPGEPLPPGVAPALARIISRCLEKTREARFQSARDLAFGLEVLSGTHAAAATAVAPEPGRRSWLHHRALPWAIAGLLAAGLIATAMWRGRPVTPAVARLLAPLPAGQRFDGSGGAHVVALSPDGTKIAYVAPTSLLYIRSISELDAKAIPGAERFEGVREPAFSPDGAWIAFYAVADQTLKKIPVTGGAAVTLCPADSPTGVSWGADGVVFGQGRKGVMRISPSGGTPDVLVRVKDGEVAHGPQVLPDGQHVLFTLAVPRVAGFSDDWDKAQIVVQSLTSGVQKPVITGGSDARYVPTGHIVYALGGSLYAVAFDLPRLETVGAARPVVEGIRRAAGTATGAANYSFSATGSLIYVPGPLSTLTSVDMAVVDRAGGVRALNLPPGPYAYPRVSPEGERIAFATDDGNDAAIWIRDLSGGTPMQRLTSTGRNRFPIWSANGRRIAFQSDRGGDLAIFWQDADGTGDVERLTTPSPGAAHVPESWSPDGATLLFGVTSGSGTSLAAMSFPARQVRAFDDIQSSTPTGAVFSPDGRWVAYSRTERNVTTLTVRPYPFTAAAYQLFSKPADSPKHPRWSPDGRELFYNANSNAFEAVSITTQPTFAFGEPVQVPRVVRFGPATSRTPYDVVRRGKFAGQFVGLITPGQREFVRGSSDQIQVVLNWFEDLKARVPPR